jgi:Family of unknown function (DUF5677)
MSEPLFEHRESFRVADDLIERPLLWSRSVPAPSDTPLLSLVKFRAFYRAVKQYSCIVQLLRAGQWEDALVLARSLYELNANLSEIDCSSNPEQAASKFVRFGKCQQLRLERRRLDDQLRDEKLKPQPPAQMIVELKQKVAAITLVLNRDFGEFRNKEKPGKEGKNKGKWQDTWSGFSVEKLAQRLAKKTGGKAGQSDYFVYALGSHFTHAAPGALFLGFDPNRATADWNEVRAVLDKAGQDGLRFFLKQASVYLVDIIGLAGDSITGYERQWFDGFALPLLERFSP